MPLEANPLEDVANTERITGVVVNGHFLDREAELRAAPPPTEARNLEYTSPFRPAAYSAA